jgi:hypothetical protein
MPRTLVAVPGFVVVLCTLCMCGKDGPAPFAMRKKPDASTSPANAGDEGTNGVPTCYHDECDATPCKTPADCTPRPCRKVGCEKGVCTDLGDRPTHELTTITGAFVNDECPSGNVCGEGIPNSSACCPEMCSNGCGGAACSDDGNSPYCCVGVVKSGQGDYPPAASCDAVPEPPCKR